MANDKVPQLGFDAATCTFTVKEGDGYRVIHAGVALRQRLAASREAEAPTIPPPGRIERAVFGLLDALSDDGALAFFVFVIGGLLGFLLGQEKQL